ncbi:MAG: type II secretion system minor pseudopilin GspK [Gammaproteobacteria bacterium]|nr:type II secretion system minor pseudopilin GspK [Gammaproteobacteria bacterium]
MAILLVALGTILAAAIAYENAMTFRRGAATYAFDQALLVQQAAEALAAYGLRLAQKSDPQHTYASEGWAQPVGPVEVVPGVMLTAQLEDLQGRFNLNNLVREDGTPDPVQVPAFQQLLAMLGLEPKWAGYLVDWIDRDIVPSVPDGAEDSVYMGQMPPYRTPNRYITSASELLALPGFGHDRYVTLAPYVTALPYGVSLNICTAKGPVLDAYLGHGDFSSDPEGLTKNRAAATGCFPAISDFQAAAEPAVWKNIAGKLQMTSSYFRLTSLIAIGSSEFNLYSLLLQDPTGQVRPILRSYTPD